MLTHTSRRPWRRTASTLKRLLVISAGFSLCGAGVIMLVLPGPGVLVVFLGLLVLASEYEWADRALERTRARALDATSRLHSTRTARLGVAMSATALITGGAAAAVMLDGHRYLGISVLVAGLAGLAMLVPATQRLIDRPPNPSRSRRLETVDTTNSPTPPAT